MKLANKRKGIMLIGALMLMTALLVLGLAYLTSKANDRKASQNLELTAQARSLALAGLERTRTKLEKDLFYPPVAAEDQDLFGYSEEVKNPAGDVVGSYTVTIDRKYQQRPFFRWRILCTGRVGNPMEPRARWTVSAELDLDPGVPTATDPYPNPTYFKLLNIQSPAEPTI